MNFFEATLPNFVIDHLNIDVTEAKEAILTTEINETTILSGSRFFFAKKKIKSPFYDQFNWNFEK